MNYFYKPYFTAKYDSNTAKMYIAGQSRIVSAAGTGVSIGDNFTASVGPAIDNEIHLVPNTSWTNMPANVPIRLAGDLTLNGVFDVPRFIDYVNGKYVAITRFQVHLSDDLANWDSYDLPTHTDYFYRHKTKQGGVTLLKTGYYSMPLTTAAIHPNLSKVAGTTAFRIPEDFLKLPTVLMDDYWGTFGEAMCGYIAIGGYWNPKPIEYLLSPESTYADPRYNKVKLGTNNIFAMLQLSNLNTHWDPNGYDSYYNDFTGAFVSDYRAYQFVCCDEGIIKYRLFGNNNYSEQNYSTIAFTDIYLPTAENVHYVAQYKFTYDYDSYYQSQSSYILFERHYAFTETSIYELVWTEGRFEPVLVATGLTGKPICIQVEYRSKWSSYNYWGGSLTGLPEIRKMHIYGTNGMYAVIDASDRTQAPAVSISNSGTNFIDAFVGAVGNKTAFITADNKIYVQNSYSSISYLTEVPHEILAIKPSTYASYIEICTSIGVYHFHETNGLSGPIRYELFIPVQNFYNSGWHEEWYQGVGTITYVNNHYLYLSQLGEMFFTNDLLTWDRISSYGSLGNYGFSVPSGIMHWTYFLGHYVLLGTNYTQFLNPTTGAITYGLDDTITENIGASIPLGNKLLIPMYTDSTIAIYDPSITVKGLKAPVYNLPIFNANSSTLMELTRLTFTTYVDRPYISIEAYGKYKGIELWVEVTPVTGMAVGYPMIYGGDTFSANNNPIHRTFQYEYTDTGHYTAGTKTISIVFYRQPWSAVDFNFIIQSISIEGRTLLEQDFDQVSWTTSGDTWGGVIPSVKQLRYYKYASSFGISSEFIKNLYNNDNKPIGFVRISSGTYLIKYNVSYGAYWPANPEYTINTYNTQNGTFEQVTDPYIIETFRTFKPSVVLNGVTGLSNYCSGIANGKRLFCTDSMGKARVNNDYLMIKAATSFTQLNSKETVVTGINGTLAIKNMIEQFYQIFILDITKTLKKAVQFSYVNGYVSGTRVVVIGSDGYVAYSDDVYFNWTTASLGSNTLNDIFVDQHIYIVDGYNYIVTTLTYRLLVVGNGGFGAYSLNNGSSWTNINFGTNVDLIGIIKFSVLNTYVVYGKNFIAVSTDMVTWNTIVTGLIFEPLTALEYGGKIFIGCKGGKIITSMNLTYWEYKSSNTASDILQLYYSLSSAYSGAYWGIWGILKSNTPMPSDLFEVGDVFYTPGNNNTKNITQGYEITSIEDPLFSINPSWGQNQYPTATLDLCKLLTWRDIFKAPSIKAYKDSDCTQEVNTTVYPIDETNITGCSYSATINPQIQYPWLTSAITVGFATEVDVSTIQYIFYPATVEEFDWDTEQYLRYNSLLTLEVESYDNVNKLVTTKTLKGKSNKTIAYNTIGGFAEPYQHTYYNSTNRINYTGIIGIPYNSFYMLFSEDNLTCESSIASLWFKNTDSSKVYDNLVITSKLSEFSFNYSFLEYVNIGINNGRSLIHNASIVQVVEEPTVQVEICTIDELRYKNPYLNEILFNNPNIIQLLNEDTKIFRRGLVLSLSNLHVFESNQVTLFNTGSNNGATGFYHEDFSHRCSAIAELRNKYYEPDFWSTNRYDSGYNGATAQLIKSADIRTAACTCRYTIGDTAGNGYYYLRCTSGSFRELQDVRGYLIFDDFVIQPYAVNQNGTQIGGWGYVDDNTLVFYPYTEYGNGYWQVTFRMPYREFTGPLKYVKTIEYYDYSSDLKQSFYEYTCGQLEFNIEQFPTIWKKAYDLPPITGIETLKVNIKLDNVVNGTKILPYNTIRLSGVEYNL